MEHIKVSQMFLYSSVVLRHIRRTPNKMPTGLLGHALCFIRFLANTAVSGLAITPKRSDSCQMQKFSFDCELRAEAGEKNLVKVKVSTCVTKENHSKDVICKRADVVTKCQGLRGELETLF